MPIEFTPPVVGRIVWGHPTKTQHRRDQQTKQVVMKDGKPVEQWAFGWAVSKADFVTHIWPQMEAEARTGYPQGVPPRFSWKYVDGDTVDSKGVPFNQREGYAGCYVLTISTEAFAPPVWKRNPATGQYEQQTPEQIKCGDFVAVGLNLKVNVATGTHTPSLYVNPTGVELVGYGTEIISRNAADPNQVFGGMQFALPPGATATPQMTPGAGAPGMPAMAPQPGYPPQQPGMMPGYPQQPMQPAMAPQPQMPMQQPGYPPQQPGMMPGAPAMGQPMMPTAAPGYPQQPMQPAMAPQPGYPAPAHDFVQNAGMPGMMPPR